MSAISVTPPEQEQSMTSHRQFIQLLPLAAGGLAAACALFPGKRVAGEGWCSAYANKA
jgi:hypothetical protein